MQHQKNISERIIGTSLGVVLGSSLQHSKLFQNIVAKSRSSSVLAVLVLIQITHASFYYHSLMYQLMCVQSMHNLKKKRSFFEIIKFCFLLERILIIVLSLRFISFYREFCTVSSLMRTIVIVSVARWNTQKSGKIWNLFLKIQKIWQLWIYLKTRRNLLKNSNKSQKVLSNCYHS